MPTGQVFRWHLRIMMQPSTTSGAVAKPNSSAPSSAPTTTSRPVFIWPSTCTAMRPRRRFEHERLLRLGETQLPRRAGVLDRRLGRRAGAAVVAGDRHVIGLGLRHARGDGADADFGHELHARSTPAGSRSSDRGSAARDPRSSRCRGAAAARSSRRPAPNSAAARCTPETLCPGNWPPSPGFAPCAILICSWSALTQVLGGDAEARRRDLLDLRAQLNRLP